ncbi:MAG TPA: type II toxin-antitoxin system RelE/ParE family toxin [Rhizomicrobium sp.]|nr:type II toxin-antitoxin system RelE/ParE family toxin [Rhizomicrobium sp.]
MTKTAQRQIGRVRAYIANDNPGAAERVRERIHEVIGHIAAFPDSGRATIEPGVQRGTRVCALTKMSLTPRISV